MNNSRLSLIKTATLVLAICFCFAIVSGCTSEPESTEIDMTKKTEVDVEAIEEKPSKSIGFAD